MSKAKQKQMTKFAGFQQIYDFAKKLYLKTFTEQHWLVKPLKEEEIKKICEEKGVKFSDLKFDSTSKLCTNACLS